MVNNGKWERNYQRYQSGAMIGYVSGMFSILFITIANSYSVFAGCVVAFICAIITLWVILPYLYRFFRLGREHDKSN